MNAYDITNALPTKMFIFHFFLQAGTPLKADKEITKQPQLIAVGPNKSAIDQYFLAIDTSFLLLPVKDVLGAVDFLFKAYHVFHTEYDKDLQNFWIYLQHYFYKIPSKCTPLIISVNTKIEVAKANSAI